MVNGNNNDNRASDSMYVVLKNGGSIRASTSSIHQGGARLFGKVSWDSEKGASNLTERDEGVMNGSIFQTNRHAET